MGTSIRHICLIDGPKVLADAFREAGCEVCELTASPKPFFDLPAALSEKDCIPDLVLQVEKLGPRSLLTGIETMDCPVLFWAIDPHLNGHWHPAYAALFDTVFSTQKAWIPRIEAQGATGEWLPWFGQEREWLPWEQREHGLTFVGRVTKHRPARKWMVEYLERRGAACNPAIHSEMIYPQMMELYQRSKIIPNESILGEVNFRLFEGACCGCLVLGQNVGPEQDELFEPGREMDTYHHIVEMDDKLAFYLRNDRLVKTMARAAHVRVQAEHLPRHRVARILEIAREATRNRCTGAEATKRFALAAAGLWEASQLQVPKKTVFDLLEKVPIDGELYAAILRLQAVNEASEALNRNLDSLLTSPTSGNPLELYLTASMAFLRLGNFDGAKTFWYRYQESRGKRTTPPADPAALLTQWAKALQGQNRLVRPGFSFNTDRHLPMTASECLFLILADQPEHLPTIRLLDSVLKPVMGMEQTRVGFLSILTLFERQDWRLAMEIGLANLHSYRLESGMEELHLARELAGAQQRDAAFLRALNGRDPSGLLAKRLG